MELRNGGQRRSYLRIGATLAVAAITLIAGGKPSEAKAADGTTDVTVQVSESDENLAWSVPTQIPIKATASGILIGSGADAITIRNLSAFPIRVKQIDTTAEEPFHLVDDTGKSSGNNDFQMSINGTAAKQTVELPDDGTWSMGYAGNEKGNDKLPITISGAKIARVTANLSVAKKAATVTWAVEPNEYVNAAVQAAVTKDVKDWTLDEQEAVAEDIAAKGDASPAYAKTKAAMDSGTTWSIALTNGETMTYRIIGINHDDLADESGKAGLTFLTISHGIYSRMNATNSNAGGWEKSELRAKMNSGEIWNLMPNKFRDKVKTVTKFTNNIGGNNENCTVTATSDRLFLLSYSEIVVTPHSGWSGYNWIGKEGSQYELFHNTVLENFSNNSIIAIGESWWERSTTPSYSTRFCNVNSEGDPSGNYDPTQSFCVLPVFCF